MALAHIAALPVLLIGLLVAFYVALPKKAPADKSNRINHIRLIWYAIRYPERFVTLFDWLRHDEGDNLGPRE